MAKEVVFSESMGCLSQKILTYDNFLRKNFKGASNYKNKKAQLFLRFERLNRHGLRFLGIQMRATGGGDESFELCSGPYAGCIPLRSPLSGLVCGCLEVKSRYGEQINEILPELGGSFTAEFEPEMPLEHGTGIQAPILMECVNFLKQFSQALQRPWQRFRVSQRTAQRPNAGTDWERFALESYDPARLLTFHNRDNLLDTDHLQWRHLTYVAWLSLEELRTYGLRHFAGGIFPADERARLSRYVVEHPKSPVTQFRVLNSDPLHIQALKLTGNRILMRHTHLRCAWRVDCAQFFERYCQHICQKAASQLHASVQCNPRFGVGGSHNGWTLRYLEPDIVMRRGREAMVVDAKYKSHMLNRSSRDVEVLKEDFRHDMHQVLAYAGLCGGDFHRSMILYPHTQLLEPQTLTIRRGVDAGPAAQLTLLGIPVSKDAIAPAAQKVAQVFGQIGIGLRIP